MKKPRLCPIPDNYDVGTRYINSDDVAAVQFLGQPGTAFDAWREIRRHPKPGAVP